MKHIIPTFDKFKLFESPDKVTHAQYGTLKYGAKDSLPFGYKNNKMHLGKRGTIHYSKRGQGNTREDMTSTGRLWLKRKIISFWNLDRKLDEVINDINDALKENGYKEQITGNWLVDKCFYFMLEYGYSPTDSKVISFDRIDSVIKTAPKGTDRNMTIKWDYAYKIWNKHN